MRNHLMRVLAVAGVATLSACGGGGGSTGLHGPGRVSMTIVGDPEAPGGGESPARSALRVDAGYTGIAHGLQILQGASLDAELRNCDGETDTACDLLAAVAGTPFAAPSPLGVGGVAICVAIDHASDVSGAMDLASGDLTIEGRIAVRVFLGPDVDSPCPACVPVAGAPAIGADGTCVGGQDDGGACTIENLAEPSRGDLRGTATACRPAGQPIAVFTSTARATTRSFAFTTSPASPQCRANGWKDRKCLCDVCDDPGATPCSTDADCPVVTGRPGVCGIDDFKTATRPNYCVDGTCSATRGSGGVCEAGPLDNQCTIQSFRACITDADCPAPGDTCATVPRPCFLDQFELQGAPDPLEGDASEPTLVGAFCAGSSGSAAVDVAGGFPGPISYVWPAKLVVRR